MIRKVINQSSNSITMATSKQDKAREEAISNLGNNFIFEVSAEPIAPEDRFENWELSRFFFVNNPWWAEPGEPMDVPEIIRDYAIDELRKQLPQGYSIEGETIINPCNNDYLKETIKRLQDLVKHPDNIISYPYPLGWWKMEVCQFHDILICFRTEDDKELFTLHEFLLYIIPHLGERYEKLYIGGIFSYCY